jgi:GNAT superfamily N-acetyltransferase
VAIGVRPGTPEDFPAVTSLLEELGRPKVLGTDAEPAHRERYEAWLAHPDRFLFVAEDDGAVVGMIDLAFTPRLNFDSEEGWIPDLVVAEAARSRGAGAALLAVCEDLARERGSWGLQLESANWRTRAHAFYVREGWNDSGHSFNKLLTDLAWPPAPPEG